ncbi:hypothetical protein VPNG_04256 [Cytospora leucostoma]|uniref:Uncharacterized protein n=1 Tax=Cytospora leucostoma TaxID=1230097 RepID=A0A423XE06_9PEZI|nr:hypothetical protein VPNG_04256 [Cytospora leucostoma]
MTGFLNTHYHGHWDPEKLEARLASNMALYASEHKFEEDDADDENDAYEADDNADASHAASNLVKAAAQHMGLPRADGAALAVAPVQ